MIISKKYGFKRDAVRLLTLEGSCSIGHRRRMSEVTMEAPCFIGDETVLEAREIRAFCMVGRRCDIRRTLRIGRYTTIGNYCCIGSRSGWKNAYLSNSMVLRKGQDDWYAGIYGWKDENKIPLEKKNPVVIGNDVWIGDNVTIYEGVSVGDGAVIQSGSVVSGDVEPYSVVWPGGVKRGKFLRKPRLRHCCMRNGGSTRWKYWTDWIRKTGTYAVLCISCRQGKRACRTGRNWFFAAWTMKSFFRTAQYAS